MNLTVMKQLFLGKARLWRSEEIAAKFPRMKSSCGIYPAQNRGMDFAAFGGWQSRPRQ
jgi:hypothetical protein